MHKLHYKGPVVLAILDGIGIRAATQGNAVKQAHLEFLDSALKNYPNLQLQAAGEAVGLPVGQMGNSEVGHNTLGCGQIIEQGLARINKAFSDGVIWQSRAWNDIIERLTKTHPGSTLHFAGIFSDGGVHSDITHLETMITEAHKQGVQKIRIHAIFDGRDVEPQSEPRYIQRIEQFCAQYPECDYQIASGAGRMVAVADRYENDWGMVQRGWQMMVHGEAEHQFRSAGAAVQYFRDQNPEIQDQDLPAFVITDGQGQPVGPVNDGDSFIYFDFRADRAVEIAKAFTTNDFKPFNRSEHLVAATTIANDPASAQHLPKPDRRPDVYFAGMTVYDKDNNIPEHRFVEPVEFQHTLNDYLGTKNISQLAISETVKFGHITYYFNGNSYDKAPGEEHIEIESDKQPFVQRPWMKAAEITDQVLENLPKYQFIRVNFPNGDMVGHYGDLEATITALEAVDLQLKRLATEVDKLGGMMLIIADHGNAEEVIDHHGQHKTSHTTNPVPCIFYDNTDNKHQYQLAQLEKPGLANVAATIAELLGNTDYPDVWQSSLIR